MRKKILLRKTCFCISRNIILAVLLLGSTLAIGQAVKWQDMGNNRKVNFYQVKQDFNQYWKGKKIGKGQGYKVFKRWETYMTPRVYPSGNMALPSTTYPNFIAWKQQSQNKPAAAAGTLGTGNWTAVGPLFKPTGYDAGVGRVDFVRFDPTNNNIMYVGTPDGGLWKTINGGNSWTTNTDFLPIIGCADLAINPTNTQIMYLATGNFEFDRRSIGVLKSTNGGATWNTTSLTWTALDNYVIRKLVMHPTNPNIMMVVTDGGIFRTTDGWATKSQPYCCKTLYDIEFKPGDPNTVYAAGKVFLKSTNNGVSWAPVTLGLPLESAVSRIALAVSPNNPAYVYAVMGDANRGFLGLYRSVNSGTSFTLRSSSPNILNSDKDGIGPGGQATHDLAIAVSPANANQVTVGGISQWRSNDGGTNWSLLSYWLGNDVNYPGEGDAFPDYVHADVQSIEYMPGSSTTMFTTCDGGISKSTNNGVNWTDISNNLSVAQQTGVALSASTSTLLVTGLQDIGTLKGDGGAFSVINGGDGESAFIDRTNDLNIVTSNPNGAHALSTDGGLTRENITGLPDGTEFFSPISQDPVIATRVYAGGRAALYRSNDFTSTWTKLGTPAGSNGILRFEVAPSNNTIIYAIKYDAISKSTNSGTTWTNITGTLPVADASLTNLTISSTDPGDVWVTFSGYSDGNKVFETKNGGISWTNVSAGLPNLPFNCIVYDKSNAKNPLYLGGDLGVYYLDRSLNAWVPYFTNLPNCAVTDLEIFYPTGKLRASTYGRGTWESNLNNAATYTIKASAGTNGTISPDGKVSVAAGANQTFTITPNPTHRIVDVIVDSVSLGAISSYTFTNVTSDHIIRAKFDENTVTINATAGANGTISPSGDVDVVLGASQTFNITPNAGYLIENVTVDNVSKGPISTFTFTNVVEKHKIRATFKCPAISLSAAITNLTCNGDNTGAINVTVTNSTAPVTYSWTENMGTFSSTQEDISGLVADKYRLVVSKANGCKADSTFTVTQPDKLKIATIKSKNVSCNNTNNGSITLTAKGGTPPYDASIDDVNYYFLTGNTITFSNLTPGSYTVYLFDSNGCFDISTTPTVIKGPSCGAAPKLIAKSTLTSKPTNSTEINVNVAPNPSRNYFTLKLSAIKTNSVQIRVLDIHGRLLFAARGSVNTTYRFGDKFLPGIYMVEVIQDTERKTIKVVKE